MEEEELSRDISVEVNRIMRDKRINYGTLAEAIRDATQCSYQIARDYVDRVVRFGSYLASHHMDDEFNSLDRLAVLLYALEIPQESDIITQLREKHLPFAYPPHKNAEGYVSSLCPPHKKHRNSDNN